jgi:phosphatidylglycerophosphate synthase
VSTPLLALAVVAGGTLVSILVYALGGRRADADATSRGSQLLLGGGNFLVHWFLWALGPAERLSLALGLTPDQLNVAGLLLGLASGLLVAVGRLELGGWAIAASGVCDILDGRIARTRGLVSPYGKFIDATLDRFVETFVFLGCAWYLRDSPSGAVLAGAALGGSLLVSYAQARGESVGVLGAGGLLRRAERLVLTCFGCLLDGAAARTWGFPEGRLLQAVMALIAVGSFATAVHRTVWIARRLR